MEVTEEDIKDQIYDIEPYITSIKNISSTEKFSEFNNLKIHYLCPNCLSFPLIIKFINLEENKKLYLKCKDNEEGIEMDLEKYKKYKTLKGDIRNFKQCEPNEKYSGYCFNCLKFVCENNSKEHEGHNIKNFIDIIYFIKKKLNIPDIIKVKAETIPEMHNIPSQINKVNDTIKYEGNNGELIQKKNNDNIDNKYSNDPFEELIKTIINDEKYYPDNNHYENIKNIFYYLSDQLEIEYHSYENQSTKIKIFNKNFINNNKNNFILLIDDKEEILKEIVEVKDVKDTVKLKLVKINEPTDLSEMFYNCDCLSKIKVINGWETSNVEAIYGMFHGCGALEELPDISKWVTKKITDLSSMFEGCKTLSSISGISNWDVENVKNLKYIFNGCESLESLDLSKWEPKKIEAMDSMFQNCNDLNSLKGLENFDTSKVTNMSYVFQNCFSLNEIEGISNWDTGEVTSFSNMFDGCESLKESPNLSNWITEKVERMNFMFSECKELEKIQGISNWEVKNVLDMNNMFENCSKLNSFPDTSKWKLNPKVDTSYIFKGCDSLKEKPNFCSPNCKRKSIFINPLFFVYISIFIN